jgi:hypothetical protein
VQLGEHVDEVLAGWHLQLVGQQRSLVDAVEHDALDVAHHVERRPVDLDVGAQPERRGHGDGGLADGGDDAELAGHVVSRLEHVAERRPAQHVLRAVSAGDREREVRPTTADQVERERRLGTVDVVAQPGRDAGDVDRFGHDGRP